jgi:hypothetical protein
VTDRTGSGEKQDHVRTAIAEFLTELEHARSDLVDDLRDAAPNDYFEVTPTGNAEVAQAGELICGAHDQIDDCFTDFDWVMRQAERRLRDALRW